MKKVIAFTFVIMLALSGCVKMDLPRASSDCLKEKIREFAKADRCADAKVDQYQFQAQTVYVFDGGTCAMDYASEVVNSDCRSMGYLGGLAGNRTINGENFDNAKFEKTVWKKQ